MNLVLWPFLIALMICVTASLWLERLIARERRLSMLPPRSLVWHRWRPVLVTLVSVVTCSVVVYAEGLLHSVDAPEVQPSHLGRLGRIGYHCVLVLLLVLGTVIDLDCCLLPDDITISGLILGILGAVAFQEWQIAHLWVDWAYEIPGIRGPYIPDWYDRYRWLHALAWSLAGALTGGVLTWGVRIISGRLLQQEALGFGDVTFMAMIGSFLGWQAVLLTFLVAPLTGLLGAALVRMFSNRGDMPYGPFLAAAAYLVLLNWGRLWSNTKMFFSDLLAVAGVTTFAIVALIVLLLMAQRLRLARIERP